MNLDCVNAHFAVKAKSYCFTMTLMTVIKAHSVGIILRNVVDVVRMFRGLIKTKRLPLGTGEQTMNKQIDGATLAVLNCYRNKYYTDGINTEQGLVANAINEVLPTLVELKNGGYCKAREIFAEIERKVFVPHFGSYFVKTSAYSELKKKYESEGTNDDL